MSRTILIVEDDVVFRQNILLPVLAAQGYTVLEAGKAQEADDLLAANRVDLLIVDGLLPDRTGMDFIASLREQGVQLPIVFLSSFFKDMTTYRRLTDLGVAHVLHKPIDGDDLCRKVAQLLS